MRVGNRVPVKPIRKVLFFKSGEWAVNNEENGQ